MKNFIYVAVLALVMTACGANGSNSNANAEAACDTIVATDIVPATATEALPVALPGDSGKVATEVVPAE